MSHRSPLALTLSIRGGPPFSTPSPHWELTAPERTEITGVFIELGAFTNRFVVLGYKYPGRTVNCEESSIDGRRITPKS